MKIFFVLLFGLLFGFFDVFFMFFMFFCFCFVFFFGFADFSFAGFIFCDGISFFLGFLTFFIFVLCFFSSLLDYWDSYYFYFYVFVMFLIFVFCFFSFFCLSYIMFYVSFEFIFLFMFLFLLGWGISSERLQASFYMVFYTLIVSMPFFVFLIVSNLGQYSSSFLLTSDFGFYWWFFSILVFMVKLPTYGVHLWLPKAHVEAPISGSMVLAGVLLKLGGYGFYRFIFSVNKFLVFNFGFLASIGLCGGLMSCFICLRQVDMKSYVAYSSVCHMGFAMTSIFVFLEIGFFGSFYMFVGHGFCSSCLFYILYLIYKRLHTRSLFIIKGIVVLFPLISFFWFAFSVFNMGVPLTLSFFSEIFIVVGVLAKSFISFLFMGLFLFFAGVYGIYLFVVGNHGEPVFIFTNFLIFEREFLLMFCHIFPLFFLPVFVSFFV